MVRIQVEIPDELVEEIEAIFPQQREAARTLASIAVEEYVQWLTGERRPSKVTDINIQRITQIYERILHDDSPDVSTLVRRFNLPLGQARYLVQAMNYQDSRALRQRGLRRLVTSLRNQQIDVPDGTPRGVQPVLLRIPTSSAALFEEVNRDLCLAHDDMELVARGRNLGSVIEFRVDALDVDRLLSSATTLLEGIESR